MPTAVPQPLARGWTFKPYDTEQTDIDRAADEWLRSEWGDCAATAGQRDAWVVQAAETVAERFAATVINLQDVIDADLLVELLCEQTVALRTPTGGVVEHDVGGILYAATRRELNRLQGGRPFHVAMQAVAA